MNDYERELLVILMEECAEVTQAASKLLRFGKENRPDTGISNSVVLAHEIGDLEATIVKVTELKLYAWSDVLDGVDRKNKRLAHFMQSTPSPPEHPEGT